MHIETALGTVEFSRLAIAALVTQAATQSYGVVGMTMPSRASNIAAVITRDPHRGVQVSISEEQQLTIDLYVIIEYGTNIASVATSLIRGVRYQVQQATGLLVEQVNVHVRGLRMSSDHKVF